MKTTSMTSHRTMARGQLFFSFFVVCFWTSFAYDLHHIHNIGDDIIKRDTRSDDIILSRHKRQADNIINNFISTLDQQDAAVILMLDRSKYVNKQLFYTEVVQLTSNILRYHVLNSKLLILTFADLVSTVYDGFQSNSDWNKCRLFEGPDAIWSKLKYNLADEASNPGPNYKKAFIKAQQLSYQHTGPVVFLVVTAGDDGSENESNLWLRNPIAWLQNAQVFVAKTTISNNTDAINFISRGNNAGVMDWINTLKNYGGSMADINLQQFTDGDATCTKENPDEFCSPYTGNSFCTSCQATSQPQPIVSQQTTTTQGALERLVASNKCNVKSCDASSCKDGGCSTPRGVSVCYCNRGFTGTDCQTSICEACGKGTSDCNELCRYQPAASKNSMLSYSLIIPCAVGGFVILIVTVILICICCRKGGGGGGGGGTKKKKTPPPPPDPSLKPVGLVAPSSRPQRIRETTPEEDNLYAHYGKIARHQNMPEWLGYIEEMVTVGHMEAAAIVRYDTSEWVCSERAFKVNQKEYDVLCRLLDKQMPNYKVKFKRKEYLLIENDGETMVMESYNPRGAILVILSRTQNFLIAVKVTEQVGLESAKNEIEWVREAIKQQEY